MPFNEILRALLKERDIFQKQLAAELSIPASTLGGYIQGTSEPDFDTLRLIVEYFGVSADYLLGIPEPKTDSEKENKLLHIFRSLSDEAQDLYLAAGKGMMKASHEPKS